MPLVRTWVDTVSSAKPAFQIFLTMQAKSAAGLGIGAYLIQPLQRVIGYMLLLDRLVSTMTKEEMQGHLSYEGLIEASAQIREANMKLDSRVREHARLVEMQKVIAGLGTRDYASGRRKLLAEIDASVVFTSQRRSFRQFGGMKEETEVLPARLFLLTDVLLVTTLNTERAMTEVLYRLETDVVLRRSELLDTAKSETDVVLLFTREEVSTQVESPTNARSKSPMKKALARRQTQVPDGSRGRRGSVEGGLRQSGSSVRRNSIDGSEPAVPSEAEQTELCLRFSTPHEAQSWRQQLNDRIEDESAQPDAMAAW